MNDGRVLLMMDYQDEFIDQFGAAAMVERSATVLAAARTAGMPVLFVLVGFRPGHPEVSPNNQNFSRAKQANRLVNPSVTAALAPREDEPVVTKRRVSPFGNTDIVQILNGFEAKHLVMAGMATSGVILSSTRIAADLDYQITILRDCCIDGEPEVHDFLMDRILSRQADISDSASFIATLG